MGNGMTPRAGEPTHPFPSGWWGGEGASSIKNTNANAKSSSVRKGKLLIYTLYYSENQP